MDIFGVILVIAPVVMGALFVFVLMAIVFDRCRRLTVAFGLLATLVGAPMSFFPRLTPTLVAIATMLVIWGVAYKIMGRNWIQIVEH